MSDLSQTAVLVRRLRHLVSLNASHHGGPYMGYAAEQCVEAMAQAADKIERIMAILEDVVSDMASTAATHDEVYYAWESIVRRADGIVADIIRRVSAEDDECDWDVQLPTGGGES